MAEDGVVGEATLTIDGGFIDITTGVESIESKNDIVINDGDIRVTVSDDGLNATNDITINGGNIYVYATTGDAVDSNGTLSINGGVIVALGGNAPEGGLDCDRNAIAMNGGIVVATGGSNSTPSNGSAQRVVVFGSGVQVGSLIHIERDTGGEALTFRVSKAYQNMIFTSPALEASRNYRAYTGGSISGGTDFHGLYTGATYSGGTVTANFTTNAVVTYVGGGGPPGP